MNGTVLVVDDMRIIRDPIAATLTAAGYLALCAENGKRALEVLPAQQVDLILLDVNMPVMDGLSFLRALRSEPSTREIPVIMLSGAEDREHVLQAARLGIRGYVLKSHFSLKDLMARVTQHFDGLTPIALLNGAHHQSATRPQHSSARRAEASTVSAPAATIKPKIKPADSGQSRSCAPLMAGEIPSLITREQCVERAKKALHGQTLSGVVAEVIALATSPRGNATDLAAMIARDPLLAARVLQAANSPAYASTRGTVATLPDAVRNIGCATVRNIAAALGIFNAIPTSDSDGLNLLRCWQHAFAVATLCNRLATKDNAAVAYLVGLCHDLGEILFHSQFAEEYQRVLEFQHSTGKPRDEVERAVLGMSQGQILQTIVKCLGLPDAISNPIQEYHSKGPGNSGGSTLTRLVRAADLYANGMLLASSNQAPVRPITCADANGVTGYENPPHLDRDAMRGEILGLTATLSRFSASQQSEVMAAPFPRRPVRVWLAREASLSSLDPVEAALDLLCELTPRTALPSLAEAAEFDAVVVAARTTSVSGFTHVDVERAVTRPNAASLPVLWLVGRVDETAPSAVTCPWPISLVRLAEFVAAAGKSSGG